MTRMLTCVVDHMMLYVVRTSMLARQLTKVGVESNFSHLFSDPSLSAEAHEASLRRELRIAFDFCPKSQRCVRRCKRFGIPPQGLGIRNTQGGVSFALFGGRFL